MKAKALVVEDDPAIHKLLKPIFVALKHDVEFATNLQSARVRLEKQRFDYGILDLTIPADEDGDFPDKQYGLLLIKEIREGRSKEDFPLVAMTSYVDVGFGLSMELHELGVNVCVSKSVEQMRSLVKIITDLLGKKSGTAKPASKPPELIPFNAEPREMVIYNDRIEVCGICLWTETTSDDMRKLILRLNRKSAGGYEHVKGQSLMKLLGRNASNPISRPIKDFRDRAKSLLAEHRHLDCGPEDIICSTRGYHLAAGVTVKIVDTENPKTVEPIREPENEPAVSLNERQQWIMSQLDKGVELRLPEIIRHTKKNRSTVNRDLKELRTKGLLTTHGKGYYVRRSSDA